ncbi:MAG: PDZ domain-containing protein [Desulfobacterales bacterium]|nr:PDZ domain-containing protein [Desulfobacterales bacterium]
MSMWTKHIRWGSSNANRCVGGLRSWITVLSVFFLVVLLCILWERFTSPSAGPLKTRVVNNPEPALAEVQPSVVSLWAIKKDLDTQISLIGCGLIVDSRGFLLTSATLTPDIESLYVIDQKDKKYDANVVTTDKMSRLTLLKANTGNTIESEGFEAAHLADFEQVREGDGVIAIGGRRTPSGWELTTKTGRITKQRQSLVVDGTPETRKGVFGGTGKLKYRNLLQTDVSLTSENAGGPLVNFKGEVIGFGLPFVKPPNSSSFSYAVPINQGKNFLARLPIPQWTDGPAEQVCSWLGAEMLPMNPVIAAQFSVPERRGEIVNHIQNNSPAEHAGLRRGDVITGINDNIITDRPTFDEMAPQLCQTDKIRLRVLREGRKKNLTVYWDKPMYVLPGGGSLGSLAEVVLVILVFSLMYYFVYKNVFDRVVLFVLGAIVIAITGHHLGFYDQDRMVSALLSKIDVLCFIVGMQLITGVLAEAGALEYLAKKITLATGGNTWRIMWLFCLVTYAFSLVVNNLTTIMLMAPMVLKLSEYLDCDPKPFLTSMIIASNLGGASTMVGDFPNMLIGAEIGLPFYQFVSYMLPICLLELFVLLAFLRIARPSLFRRVGIPKTPKDTFGGLGANNSNSLARGAPFQSSTPNENQDSELWDTDFLELSYHADTAGNNNPFFHTIKHSLPKTIKNRDALRRGLMILAGVTMGFLLSDSLNCSPAIIALAGGIIALAFGACEPFSLLQKVSIRDILFFSGLFVLVGAAEASGALNYISEIIVHLSFGNLLILCLLLMWAGAFVTCFLNAGPTTALFLPVVLSFKSAAPHNMYWWALSLGVCAGSSGTLVGATAGGVTATMIDKFIKKQGGKTMTSPKSANKDTGRYKKLTFQEYASLGLPMMLIFLLMSSIYIVMIYRW